MAHNRPHHFYMTFFLLGGWQVQFLSPDLLAALPNKLTFADPEKMRELATRAVAGSTSSSLAINSATLPKG
jgi:hypothetical protein